ncbi:MAG: hypothetical protein ACJATI_005512 [Halioglobus sp.]|jgi:hypothetical protein
MSFPLQVIDSFPIVLGIRFFSGQLKSYLGLKQHIQTEMVLVHEFQGLFLHVFTLFAHV